MHWDVDRGIDLPPLETPYLCNILSIMEICGADPIGMTVTLSYIPLEIVEMFGNREQKDKFLLPTVNGEFPGSVLITESSHGSFLNDCLETCGEKKEDEWVINGKKQFITNGTVSKYGALLFQFDPNANPPYKGQNLIVIDMKSPTITKDDMANKLGLPTSPHAYITIDGLTVPEENLIGEEGKGLEYSAKFLDKSRVNIAAQAVGLAQGAYDMALKYAKQREQGKKIIDFQAVKHSLAMMQIQIEAARQMTYKAAWKVDQGKTDGALSAAAKYYAAEVAMKVTRRAAEIFAGSSWDLEQKIGRYARDARILPMYEGTAQIQLNRIGRDL